LKEELNFLQEAERMNLSVGYEMGYLFASVPDSNLAELVEESLIFYEHFPVIGEVIEADQDEYGLAKKAIRDEAKRYGRREIPSIPELENSLNPVFQSPGSLGIGRPRMNPFLVFLFLILRGYFGSASDRATYDLFLESITIRVLLDQRGIPLPKRQTLVDNLNAVTNATRELILDCQIQYVYENGLDDFQEITIDSTPVSGCALFPNDAISMRNCLFRAYCILEIFAKEKFIEFQSTAWLKTWRSEIGKLASSINMVSGKNATGKRKKMYRRLIHIVEKTLERLNPLHEEALSLCAEGKFPVPTWADVLTIRKKVDELGKLLKNASATANQARKRLLEKEKVPVGEKFLGLGDPDASLIVKGGREVVFGYRPNLARSRNGFIVEMHVEKGNTSDSKVLMEILSCAMDRTGIIPKYVTTDDGYASEENRTDVLKCGVGLFTVSGAKGKKITPESEWKSPAAKNERKQRSAVESLISTLKGSFGFGRTRRTRLENVKAEMLEKVLAFNFERIALIRSRLPETKTA